MKGLSYTWKTLLPFLAIVLIALVCSNILIARSIDQFITHNWEQNLLQQARLYADSASSLIQAGSPYTGVDEIAKSHPSDIRVTILLTDGTVIGDSTIDPAKVENQIFFPEVKAALKGKEGIDTRQSVSLKTGLLFAAVPIQSGGQVIGVARTSIPMSAMDAEVRNIRNINWIILGITLVVTGLLAVVLSAPGINPLRKLTRQVDLISSTGEFTPLRVSLGHDEISTLTMSFNRLISDLNQQITQLGSEQAILGSVLSNMSDGVIIVSPEGNVKLINQAAIRLFNVAGDISREKTLIEVTRLYQLVEIWKKSLATGETQTTTLELLPDNNYVQVIASPLGASFPGVTLLLAQDLTRLRKLETVRRDFVQNVSHALDTPLSSLKTLAESLQSGKIQDNELAPQILTRMNIEIDKMLQIVHELLELARIETGKTPFEFRPVQPKEIVLPAIERMKDQAERASLDLNTQLEENLPPVLADALRMQEVLINLIHNAIKFTPSGGKVTVKVEKRDKFVQFCVEDTGIGIKPADLDRIFERFYRSDRTINSGGTGLGLSIAKHTIEAHQGKIWAESEPGRGATFFFTIPVVE